MGNGFKDREHLFRVAALFLVGLAIFFVARVLFVPKDFGRYGHYRAGALDDIRAHPIAYAGQAACVECHSDVGVLKKTQRHAGLSCETCHGALAQHASGDLPKPPLPDGRTVCIGCHAANRSKPKFMPQVVIADHAPDGRCVECHKPHAPKIV